MDDGGNHTDPLFVHLFIASPPRAPRLIVVSSPPFDMITKDRVRVARRHETENLG